MGVGFDEDFEGGQLGGRSVRADALPVVAVLGLGYVGFPVVSGFVSAGFRVVGIDQDPRRVQDLAEGIAAERVGLPLTTSHREERLHLTTRMDALARADVVFICVPTPQELGEAQHHAVRACAASFAQHGRADALVILESTVRPGFVEDLQPALGHGGGVALAYAPERIDPQPGQAGLPLRDIPRLVAGVDERAQSAAADLLEAVGVTVHRVPLRVAEYAKLLENSYRLLNVAFIDEFAALCRADGVDPHTVVRAAATKPFGFQAFWPGVGAGGHCVAVDPAFLANHGRLRESPLSLLEAAIDANSRRPYQVAASVVAHTPPGSTVLLVGLTYKAGVADTRESAALFAARALMGMDRRVLAYDALAEVPPDLRGVDLLDGLAQTGAAVLLVPQPEPVRTVLLSAGRLLLDATGTLPGAVAI